MKTIVDKRRGIFLNLFMCLIQIEILFSYVCSRWVDKEVEEVAVPA